MRIERQDDGWIATSPSGTQYRFRTTVTTSGGVYAWYLDRVETIHGDAAELEYATSPGGRPFVTGVRYGGREAPETHVLGFEYEILPTPLVDYRSGSPLLLDRRVSRVIAQVTLAGTSELRERWRYDVTYRDAEFGPGFYLDSVMRTFPSGESEPPISYDYDLPEEFSPAGPLFQTGDPADSPGIWDYLNQTPLRDGLLPERAALTDVDEDGLPDLEYALDFQLFRQTPSGAFVGEPLPPPPLDADPLCRPPDADFNRARTLVRMAGVGQDLDVLVFDIRFDNTTDILVCDRVGIPRLTARVDGEWSLDANVKLVDLNRDERPDIVLVNGSSGTYTVLENVSGDGCGDEPGPSPPCVEFGFRAHDPVQLGYLGFPFMPTASWAHDMNGDGNPDLVQRTDARISVWNGRGRFGFDVERQLEFFDRGGNELGDLDDWQIQWVDANKDGLTDAILVRDRTTLLFINEGDRFEEAVSELLEDARTFNGLGPALVGDFRATGELDFVFVGLDGATAAAVTTPSTGLLIGTDDGQGTVVTFGYHYCVRCLAAAVHQGRHDRRRDQLVLGGRAGSAAARPPAAGRWRA